jgi:hypothetical protein
MRRWPGLISNPEVKETPEECGWSLLVRARIRPMPPEYTILKMEAADKERL